MLERRQGDVVGATELRRDSVGSNQREREGMIGVESLAIPHIVSNEAHRARLYRINESV